MRDTGKIRVQMRKSYLKRNTMDNESIDLAGKKFCILGLTGSGKTWLAKHILASTPSHMVYDPLGEYEGFRQFQPKDRHSIMELDEFIENQVYPFKPALFVLDEANRYLPANNKESLPPFIADLIDLHRHWGVAWGAVSRRPTQFSTDIVEQAHYTFLFTLPGANDRKRFNSLVSGLGDVVSDLPKHHFAVLENSGKYWIHAPVNSGIDTLKSSMVT